jgi:hypothetical protein
MTVRKFILIVFFPLIIFSGCSIKDGVKSGSSDEEILRDRVVTFWDHKIKGEFDKSYGYELPLFRKKTQMVEYIGSFNPYVVQWHSAKVDKIKVEGTSASVEMTIRTEVRLPKIRTSERDSLLTEKWVKVDDVWYHVPSTLGEDVKGK